MSFLEGIKDKLHICNHQFEIRYDERYDLADEKHHNYKIEVCKKCGKIKSIEKV